MNDDENKKRTLNWQAFPIALLCVAAYLLLGFLGGWWHPGWLVFLAIPLYHGMVDMIVKRRIRGIPTFLVAIVSTVVYIVLGVVLHMWHPTWLIFLAIPITASLESFFNGGVRADIKRAGDKVKGTIKKTFGNDDDDDCHAGSAGDIE